MDDRYSMRAPLRPIGRGANPVAPPPADEDPLVELARIVSGRPASQDAGPRRRASSLADEPGMSEADLARDLEAELLSDLQASLAAVGEAHDSDALEEEAPSFTDEAYVTEQYRDDPLPDEQAYGFEPEPPMAEEPPLSAGSLFVGNEEPEDLRPYRPQPRQPQAPVAAPPDSGADFGHLGLRRNKRNAGGPAYNPRALAPEPTVAAQPPAWEAPVRPPSHEPFEAVARQSFDGPSAEPDFRGIADYDERSRAEPALGDDAEEDFRFAPIVAPEPPRRSRGRAGTILMGLVAVGVAAAVFFYFRDGTTTATPPLIMADASPVRQVPSNPTAPEPPNAIYTRIDPTEGAAPVVMGAQPETPVDPAANATTPADGITQLIADPAAATDPADDRRLVRTVVMAPDGTIVNNQAGAPGITPAELPATNPTPATAADTTTAPNTPATAPTTPVAPLTTAVVPPTPVAAAPAAAAVPVEAPPAGTAITPGWYVQMSSQTTEAAARTDISNFRTQAPTLLAQRPAVLQTATVGGVVRYRVQFGPGTQAEATNLCNSIKAAGVAQCIVVNNP